MTMQTFEGVRLSYLPGIPETEHYDPADEERVAAYLPAIVLPDSLEEQLHEDFVHIDGAVVLDPNETPRVQNVAATVGKQLFIHIFRDMVNDQIEPHGTIESTWLTRGSYAPLEEQVKAQLPASVNIPGRLLGAAAVRFPYVLRPGGTPLDLPKAPAFQRLLEPGEKPFEPLRARGNINDDFHTVNVLQAVYGNDQLITGRVGLVWDDARAVPFSINRQIRARRASMPDPIWRPLRVAWHLDAAAGVYRPR
jgi:hypothetical protein